MTSIPGASRFLNSAVLANTQGRAAQTTNLIGSLGTVDLLDVARSSLGNNGVGLSNRARALNKQFLQSTSANFNSVFSNTTLAYTSVEDLRTQVLAVRAKLGINNDNAGSVFPDADKGTNVDTEA